MSIFRRLNRVIKFNLNAPIAPANGPDEMIRQMVTGMEAALGRARTEPVEVMGSAKRLANEEPALAAKLEG